MWVNVFDDVQPNIREDVVANVKLEFSKRLEKDPRLLGVKK